MSAATSGLERAINREPLASEKALFGWLSGDNGPLCSTHTKRPPLRLRLLLHQPLSFHRASFPLRSHVYGTIH